LTYRTLEVEREGSVCRVWLNRPERRNAVDVHMLRDVGDFFRALEADFETRVVVLGGRGKSFCAGADRKPPAPGEEPPSPRSDRERRWLGHLGRRACRAIEECEAVTIARVHGHAIGGGAAFALSCDFRIAATDAVFRVPEVELGVPLSWAATPRLLQEIGAARTREVLLLCEEIRGEQAREWGLVHRAVAPEDLDEQVKHFVDALLDKPELAVHMTKTQLRGYARLFALGDASEADGDLIDLARRSSDARARFGSFGPRGEGGSD
jgi:enoyl-CoA hydratase/carnithine racemase